MSPSPAIAFVLDARPRDLGDGMTVRRALPRPHTTESGEKRRSVGPFVFWDHIGPAIFPPGHGMDVRPHPHIGLATITYLFDGEIFHRDSLGSALPIRPGDVNWMVAGRGIVHSERLRDEVRASGQRLHGIQAWIALPTSQEECDPAFFHVPSANLPRLTVDGIALTVIAGDAFGLLSPVPVASRTLYVHGAAPEGTSLIVPEGHVERAVYVAEGTLEVAGFDYSAGTLVGLAKDEPVAVHAKTACNFLLLGGDPLGERFLVWNFVSSSEARIEEAKRAWKNGEFPKVPGDEIAFIPLPE
jgi:hypothetical protein